jgi:hypothetical protein
MLIGKCLCGAVEFSVEDQFEYAGYCHCSRCRATTGSAFSAFAGIRKDKVRITRGGDWLSVYERNEDNFGYFCRSCRSGLYSIVCNGEYAHVQLGTLLEAPSIRPQFHIFVDSKAPWHQISDTLPQFPEFPPLEPRKTS